MLKAATMATPLINEINMRRLTKQVIKFYKGATFMPAPSVINLYDIECLKRVADDLALISNDVELRNKIIKLKEVF